MQRRQKHPRGRYENELLSELFANVGNVTWQHAVMWCIGGVLIYLAIAKKMEPALLCPSALVQSCQSAAFGAVRRARSGVLRYI